MIRPYPLYLLLVLGFSEYLIPQTTIESDNGIVVWLCVVPMLAILTAAVMFTTMRKNKQRVIAVMVPKISACIILISWSIAVFWMSWIQIVRSYIGDIVVLDEIVILLPAIVALAILWFVTGPSGARTEWATHRIRVDLMLLLLPVLLIWTIRESMMHLGITEHLPVIEVTGILFVLVSAPLLITAILPAHPMQDKVLRKTVLDIGSRAGVRLRRVCVWNTHQRLMNAIAIGIIPLWRTVVLSDKLISHVTPIELLAVTTHEIAHHRFRHALFLCLTLFSILFWSDWFLALFIPATEDVVMILVQLPIMIITLVFVSRQFERQADTYAAVDLSQTQGCSFITPSASMALSSALGAIAWVHQISTDRYEPLHGSIASRQEYLVQIIGLPTSELPIDRKVRWIKMFIIVLFITGIFL